jgi:hypothetical protein
MKKLMILGLSLLAVAYSAAAQEFKPFKVGVGVGYAVPGAGKGAGGGGLFYIEPGYRASEQVLVGLRLESAVIARGMQGVGDSDVKGDATSNVSYTLNGQYYFNDNYVRPFVGMGFGLFSLGAMKFNTATGDPDANEIGASTKFGFYPRVGVDVGHFNLTLDYNVVPRSDVPGGGTVRNSYFGIRTGISIGGGAGRKTSNGNDK